jgi:single-strand DNA-binding protein
MATKNRISLIGNLGQDPELKEMPDGRKVCNFSVATHERFLNKDTNAWEDSEPDWHRIVVWGKRAESAAARLRKGAQVGIEGRLRVRSYVKEGITIPDVRVVADEILFLNRYEKKETAAQVPAGQAPEAEDDLPF